MTHHDSKYLSFLNSSKLIYLMATLLLLNTLALKAENWSVKVANWNIENFYESKGFYPNGAPRSNLLNGYVELMSDYDIIFIQEVKGSGNAFLLNDGLAYLLRAAPLNYLCSIYSQAGRSNSATQERYALCYKPTQPNGDILRLNTPVADYCRDDHGVQGCDKTAKAVNNTDQNTQNIWMRPPIVPSFTYTPNGGTPLTFSVYNSHTKPYYKYDKQTGKIEIPPGTPTINPDTNKPTRKNESVKYELVALEKNLQAAGGYSMIIGDLNADCRFLPKRYEKNLFKEADGWTWLIKRKEKTNLKAKKSKCAYDRIILDDDLYDDYYLDHGIVRKLKQGGLITDEIDGKPVSDHALVWVELGKKNKKQKLSTGTAVPVAAKPSQAFTKNQLVHIQGANFPAGIQGKVHVAKYNANANFKGNQVVYFDNIMPAVSVSVTQNGNFDKPVVWGRSLKGLYNVIFTQSNGDSYDFGIYSRINGDFINHSNQIDFIVTDGSEGHNQLVTLDDNANVREDFNLAVANNINLLAKDLPELKDVDIYVVSEKLLRKDGFTTWTEAKQSGNFQLEKYGIPVNKTTGVIELPKLTLAEKKQTVKTSEDGTLFFPFWRDPITLASMIVFEVEPSEPVDKENYKYDELRDPCEAAFKSDDANFRAVCNTTDDNSGLYSFLGYYGHAFNVVIDVDRQGFINKNTVVDSHDIGDMQAYFARNSVLDERANGLAVVGEYQEYLNAKLNLSEPLTINNIFDEKTKAASNRYLCAETVPRYAFENIIKPGAEVGFKVLERDTYLREKRTEIGVFRYDNVEFYDSSFSNQTCSVVQEYAELEDITFEENSKKALSANHVRVSGDHSFLKNASACIKFAGSAGITALSTITTGGSLTFLAGSASAAFAKGCFSWG